MNVSGVVFVKSSSFNLGVLSKVYVTGIRACLVVKRPVSNDFFWPPLFNIYSLVTSSKATLFASSYNVLSERCRMVMALSNSVFITTNSSPLSDSMIRNFCSRFGTLDVRYKFGKGNHELRSLQLLGQYSVVDNVVKRYL